MDVPPDHRTLSPLQLLLDLMRERWGAGAKDAAANLAKIAAPYVHARARPEPPDRPVTEMSDEELDRWIAEHDGEPDEAED